MSLGLEDVRRIAELGHIDISDDDAVRMQGELNDIFKMHPHDGVQRLREDEVVFGDDREENMKNAPEEYEGLFLVPRVVE